MTGTILLVAIAVVLGALVGGYVFNVVQKESTVTPQVSFTYDYDRGAGELTVTHESGNTFDGNNVEFVCKSGGCGGLSPPDWSSDDKVTSGDEKTITGVGANSELLVVWEQPVEGGKTAILDEWEGPEA